MATRKIPQKDADLLADLRIHGLHEEANQFEEALMQSSRESAVQSHEASPRPRQGRARSKLTLDLSEYGLEGLTQGTPVRLYHGTTSTFSEFSFARNRDELVNKFYGRGIFLTPSKSVAWAYANANRNMGLPKEVIADLRRINRVAGNFLAALYTEGRNAWESHGRKLGIWMDSTSNGEGQIDLEAFDQLLGGVDPHTLMDISKHIVGTAYPDHTETDTLEEMMTLFGGRASGSPERLYRDLEEIGLDSMKYRPKVLTVVVTVENPLVTASKTEARRAQSMGYDSVVYYGSDLVEGVPEVAVYDPNRARITAVEV